MALNTNLVSHWKLDEASGSGLDAHGANTLTDNNTVGTASGKVGNARLFVTANSEYLSRASNSDLQTGDLDFTLACWVYLVSKPGHMWLACKWGGDPEYGLYYDTSLDRFRWIVRNTADSGNGAVAANTLGSPSTGVWYLLVGVHDAANNQVKLSVNGAAFETMSHSGGVRTGLGQFRIGANTSGNYADARIDEVALWKRALAIGEVGQLYNGGAGRTYESLFEHPITVGSRLDNGAAYSPSVALKVDVATRLDNGQVWTPSVANAISVGTRLDNGQTFAPSVAQRITIADRLDAAQVYSPSVGLAVSVGSRLDNGATYAPSVANAVAVAARLDSGAVYEPSVAQRITVADRLDNGEVWSPAVAQAITVASRLDAGAVYSPSVALRVAVAERLDNGAVYAPVVGGSGRRRANNNLLARRSLA